MLAPMPDPRPPPAYVRTPTAAFLSSLAVDRSLARVDLAGSVVHAEMLGRANLVTPDEAKALTDGLRAVAAEVADGRFAWRDDLEDVHTNVEVRLTELVGAVGGKLHTARSRNDQIALDERLYLREAVASVASRLAKLEGSLLARASVSTAVPMPGYTHLQRAQPVTVAHYLLAHFWRFDRDLDRLFATEGRANVSPLGAGALAGSTLPIDPTYVAARLGFDRAFENSLDAVSDRDPLVELLFDLALLAVHASGFAEEVVVFASKEFGFIERTPALGGGSSLMPQKCNPDAAELVRAKAGGAIGDLVTLLAVLKGLPLAYDRDLQEDKAPVLRAVATLSSVLDTVDVLVRTLAFDPARVAAAAADPELYATDLAERLVAGGVPFREAHEAVGSFYRSAGGAPATEALRVAAANLPRAGDDASVRAALDLRGSPGGPAPLAVAHQLSLARSRLAARTTSLSSLDRKVRRIGEILDGERT